MRSRAQPGDDPFTASRRPRYRRWKSRRRAVSDVVATIILLAMTVTLFAAIFAFVTSFPSPPAQNSNQFQAKLLYNATGTGVMGVNITHLAGPAVSGTALVYLKSSAHPTGCAFTSPKTVSSGISSTTWNLGQVWNGPFSKFPGCASSPSYVDPLPDNVTIYVVSATQLLFSVVLPGQQIVVAPAITSAWVSPSTPVSNAPFRVYATTTGYLGTVSPMLTIPGVTTSGSVKMWLNKTTGDWQFNSTGVAAGSYSGFLNLTNAYGQTAASAVSFTVVATGTSSPLTVAVSLSSQPPLANATSGLYFIAYVTYTGSLSGALNVSFWPNETAGSVTPLVASTAIYGPTGVTLAGPSTVTVFSYSPSSGKWTIPRWGAFQLKASATLAGVGTASGFLNFTTSKQFGTTSPYLSAAASTTCTVGTNCPSVEINVYNNWTVATVMSTTGHFYINGSTNTVINVNAATVGIWSKLQLVGATQWKAGGTGSYTVTFVAFFTNGVGLVKVSTTITG